MRKLNPAYEMFIKEQVPKYKDTFIDWFLKNQKIGDLDFLGEIKKRNFYYNTYFGDTNIYINENYACYFKDFFTKKMQLIENVFQQIAYTEKNTYNLDIVANIMDLHEDVINEICTNDNVYVCDLPNGSHNNRGYITGIQNFDNFSLLQEEFSTGVSIVYCFKIFDNFSIDLRYYKREPLTRKVLFERTNNQH
jgi:hypothetical protein